VYLPPGTYSISGPNADGGCLTLKNGVTLSGAGAGTTTLKLADGSGAVDGIVRASAQHNTVDAKAADLTIDGNQGSTSGTVNGLVSGSATNPNAHSVGLQVSGVELTNCSGSGLVANTLTDDLLVTDSVAHHNGDDGFTTRFASYVDSGGTAHRDVITGFDVTQDYFDLSDLKFQGLRDGHNGTLLMRYYVTSDTTVLGRQSF
jgi:hypothetical protein